MAEQTVQDGRRQRDYAVALTRLFIEAFNARDYEAARALVSEDVELRGPNGSSLRGHPAASELLETAAHLDIIVVRTALEELEDEGDGVTRVTVPIRELNPSGGALPHGRLPDIGRRDHELRDAPKRLARGLAQAYAQEVPSDTAVGIVANPASGRDIRRLVAGASVFGNADKAGMVLRLLVGLGACGVGRALLMPAADGLGSSLERQLRSHSLNGAGAVMPSVEVLPIRLTGTAEDTLAAVRLMRDARVSGIIVLGGDGTHRAVAKACGAIPICALSTGTNNTFPEMREATTAGMATALAITGRGGPDALRREMALAVECNSEKDDLALVDVALTDDRFVGARALWHPQGLRELVVTMADPAAVGLSAIAGRLEPFERGSGRGLHVRFARTLGEAELRLDVPLAPGLIAPVAVAGFRPLELGDVVTLTAPGHVLALDGERELELAPEESATVRLCDGPLRVDVDAVMRHAATESRNLVAT